MTRSGDYTIGDFVFRNLPMDETGKPSKSVMGTVRGVLNRYYKNRNEFRHLKQIHYGNKLVYEITQLNKIFKKEKKRPSYQSVYASETIIQGHFMFTGSCDKAFIKLVTTHLRGIPYAELKEALVDRKDIPLVSLEKLRGKTYLKFTKNVPLQYFSKVIVIKEAAVEPAGTILETPKKRELSEEEILLKQQKKKEKKKKQLEAKRLRNKQILTDSLMDSQEKLNKRYEEMERLKQLRIAENEKELKRKGIYLTHPNAYKRCENCANFNSASKCSSYYLTVSENHSCRRFYSFKTVYGGGFSPR